jgi:hypothetical protein
MNLVSQDVLGSFKCVLHHKVRERGLLEFGGSRDDILLKRAHSQLDLGLF